MTKSEALRTSIELVRVCREVVVGKSFEVDDLQLIDKIDEVLGTLEDIRKDYTNVSDKANLMTIISNKIKEILS